MISRLRPSHRDYHGDWRIHHGSELVVIEAQGCDQESYLICKLQIHRMLWQLYRSYISWTNENLRLEPWMIHFPHLRKLDRVCGTRNEICDCLNDGNSSQIVIVDRLVDEEYQKWHYQR